MRNLLQLFRVVNEMVFMLVGALLLWLALTGRYFFDPRQPSWLILAGVLVVWGVYTWSQARRVKASGVRLAMKIGASSVVLVGLIMASLGWAPFAWAGVLLGAAGSVFVLRGLVAAAILAWSS
jgi:hypothetical protein